MHNILVTGGAGYIGNKIKVRNIIKVNNINFIIHCAGSLDVNEAEKNKKNIIKDSPKWEVYMKTSNFKNKFKRSFR